MEGVREFVEVVREEVRAKIVQDGGQRFRILQQFQPERPLGRFGEQKLRRRVGAFSGFAENRADADIGVLQVGRGIALERQKLVPRENIIGETVLRELRVFHRTKADHLRGRLRFVRRKLIGAGGKDGSGA